MSEFPIMAYLGVHNKPNKLENYKDFKDCGFNLSMWRFDHLEDEENHTGVKEACELADKAGIGVIACCNEMYENPTETAKIMKDLKGFAGYYICDELKPDLLMKFNEWYVKPILSVDDTHIIYDNLNPYYNDDVLEYLGVSSYQEYLDIAKDFNDTQISFDFYPVTDEGLRRDAWYRNLQMIQDMSKETGKDFWAFILSVPHICYPQPELSHLRIQAYTNLAYGAQGLQYFTYQTPVNDPDYDFHNGPIDVDYLTKTNTWETVKYFNEKLKKVLPIFHHATDFQVVRTHKVLWWNQLHRSELPDGFNFIEVNGYYGAIVSTFKNNDREYLMVVNSRYDKDVRLTICTNNYNYVNKETLEESNAKCFYTLGAGDCQIFVKKK